MPASVPDDLARLHLAREVFGHADDERDLAFRRRAQHHDARAQLAAQLIDKLAHLRLVDAVYALCQHLHALDFDR